MKLNDALNAMPAGDTTVFSIFAVAPNRVLDQTRKQKPGASHFCANNIAARLFALTTKRLAVIARRGKQKGKRRGK
jgi:hypothetical protein